MKSWLRRLMATVLAKAKENGVFSQRSVFSEATRVGWGNRFAMDAKTNIKKRLPSRHVTGGPERAPHRSYLYAMGLTTNQIHQPFVGAGEKVMELISANIRQHDIVTRKALENAVAVVAGSGGSTNAALHLPAIAHECGIKFDLFDV